jgi:hypothetical protein
MKRRLQLAVLCAAIACSALETQVQQIRIRKVDGDQEFVCPVKNGKLYSQIDFKGDYAPGLYKLNYEYQTRNVAWAGQFYTSVKFANRRNLPVTVINPSSTGWTRNHVMFELKATDKVGLRLRVVGKGAHFQGEGSPAQVVLRNLEITPFTYRESANLLDDDGAFSGPEGGFPGNWSSGYGKIMTEGLCGLSAQHPFEAQAQSLLVGVAANQDKVILRGVQHIFPKSGVIEFSAWIKSIQPDSVITLNLWGDKHKWQTYKQFSPTSQWKKYTVKLNVPQQIQVQPDFWPGIIVKSGQIAVGKAELTYHNPQSFTERGYLADLGKSRNLITNPDFELGYWGWMEFARSGRVLFPDPASWREAVRQPMPELIKEADGNHALKLYPEPSLISFIFPLQFGKTYTVSLYLRSAQAGQRGTCKLLLLDQRWQAKSREFKFDDQWQRYSFTFTNDLRSKLSSFYLRFRSCSVPMLVDKVQVEEGALTDFTSQAVQLGLVTDDQSASNIFSLGQTNAKLLLKAHCSPQVKGPITIKASVKDAWERVVANTTYQVEAPGQIIRDFPIKTDLRGAFAVTLRAFAPDGDELGVGCARYAVCKDLSGTRFTSNPYDAHMNVGGMPLDYMRTIVPVVSKYLPPGNFTRAQIQLHDIPGFLDDPQNVAFYKIYIKTFENLSHSKVMACGFSNMKLLQPIVDNYPDNQADVERFLDYVKTSMEKLAGVITYWEVFNEPDLLRVMSGPLKGDRSHTPKIVGELFKRIRIIANQVDPQAKIVGPCIHIYKPEWLEEFLKNGGAGSFDILSYHGYCQDPNSFQMAKKIAAFRKILRNYGMNDTPVINSEQYFGVQLPFLRFNEKEYFRFYFSEKEIDCAAMYAKNLIHHASAGTSVANFSFFRQFIRGLRNDYFVFAKFAAVNAAIEMLGNAGTGQEVNLGELANCFVFADAKDGVLTTLTYDGQARLTLPRNDIKVFDLMGNPLPIGTLDLSPNPLYLKFPAAMPKNEALALTRELNIESTRFPISSKISLTPSNRLVLALRNRGGKSLSGDLRILKASAPWRVSGETRAFAGLTMEAPTRLEFDLPKGAIIPIQDYEVSYAIAVDGKEQVFTETISVLFASFQKDLSWEKASSDSFALGAEHTSKRFDLNQTWGGHDDLSARAACCWNESGLALFIQVKDDQANFPQNEFDMWKHDSIQIYFDMKNNAPAKASNSALHKNDDTNVTVGLVNGDRGTVYLNAAPTGRYIGANNQTKGIDPEIKLTAEKQPDNHTILYKVFFPKSSLPEVDFAAGTEMGLAFLINDNDGQGRKTGLTLTPKGTEPYKNEHLFKTLVLTR